MEQTKGDPYSRDLYKLLQTLIRIKETSERNSQTISEQNLYKLNELCARTPQFRRDIETYLSRKKVKSLNRLRQYDAIELKLLYVDRYIRRR